VERFRQGPWTVSHDRLATADAHMRVGYNGVEECGCAYCINFAAGRTAAYPPEFRDLLDVLGIPADAEVEVYETGKVDNGTRQYHGWFHFIGVVEDWPKGMTNIGSSFSYYFTNDTHLVDPRFSGDNPVAQLEFETQLAWLIEIQEPNTN
jgi:hypothetical protein